MPVIYTEKEASYKESIISAEFALYGCSLTAQTLAATSHFFLSSHNRWLSSPSQGVARIAHPVAVSSSLPPSRHSPEYRCQSWPSRPPASPTIFFLKFPLPQTRMLSFPSASSSGCFFSRSTEGEHSLHKTRERMFVPSISHSCSDIVYITIKFSI